LKEVSDAERRPRSPPLRTRPSRAANRRRADRRVPIGARSRSSSSGVSERPRRRRDEGGRPHESPTCRRLRTFPSIRRHALPGDARAHRDVIAWCASRCSALSDRHPDVASLTHYRHTHAARAPNREPHATLNYSDRHVCPARAQQGQLGAPREKAPHRATQRASAVERRVPAARESGRRSASWTSIYGRLATDRATPVISLSLSPPTTTRPSPVPSSSSPTAARVHADQHAPRARHPADSAGGGRPARARRPAPPARPAPAHRGGAGGGRAGAGGRLRPALARSGRGAVRHDQREAHQAEPFAPHQPSPDGASIPTVSWRRATTSSGC
jgi:hypothetical protein